MLEVPVSEPVAEIPAPAIQETVKEEAPLEEVVEEIVPLKEEVQEESEPL